MGLEVDTLIERLRGVGYIADRGLGTALASALALGRPLLLEGEAGVGKTEAARALAQLHEAKLVRLQCYEGLDLASAAYDWNYARQLLAIRQGEALGAAPRDLYGDEFLLARPLLEALGSERPLGIVLLIDEIDRADDEFEAFLLEYLQDYAMTIPERGRVAATYPPAVILTSNRTRDLHDALKRRCFYHWIEHPGLEREVAILRLRLPEARPALHGEVAQTVQRLRAEELRKAPGIAEALDWVRALDALDAEHLDASVFGDTIGTVLKYPEDIALARGAVERLLP